MPEGERACPGPKAGCPTAAGALAPGSWLLVARAAPPPCWRPRDPREAPAARFPVAFLRPAGLPRTLPARWLPPAPRLRLRLPVPCRWFPSAPRPRPEAACGPQGRVAAPRSVSPVPPPGVSVALTPFGGAAPAVRSRERATGELQIDAADFIGSDPVTRAAMPPPVVFLASAAALVLIGGILARSVKG